MQNENELVNFDKTNNYSNILNQFNKNSRIKIGSI
jgi:hypothetical protein